MELKPGYKQTEIGFIPEDWQVKAIEMVCFMKSGEGITTVKIDDSSQYPCYGGNGLRGYTSRYTHNGFFALIGRQGALCGNVIGVEGKFFASEHAIVVTPRQEIDIRFLTYVLTNMQLNRYSESSAQPGLSVTKILQLPIAIPHTEIEQRAIANALSDVDALLDSLELLISKKRAIKQAAMQQLLTGEKRLPGFEEPWEMFTAGEIGQFRGGSGFPTRFQGSTCDEYPFFKVSDMNNEGNETFMITANNFISEHIRKQIGAILFPANSIVFAKVGAAIFLERKKILSQKSCLDNNMVAYVLCASRADCRFIHYLLLNMNLGNLVSTTALPSLNGGVLSKLVFTLPSLEEQRAIANVLSDMDEEITVLEKRRSKTQNLKQAMMHELLTGKTRLTVTEDDHV